MEQTELKRASTLTQRLLDTIVNAIQREADAKGRLSPTICIVDEEGAMMLLRRGDAQVKDSVVVAALLAKCAQQTGTNGKWPVLNGNMNATISKLINGLLSEEATTVLHDFPFDVIFYDLGSSYALRDLGGEIIGAIGVVAENLETSKEYAKVGHAVFDERLTLDTRSQA
ncbi:MAG: hypothetical protein HGA33_06455 [Candidatus Moranbacteria bacterium]|nr:hypothetical protein [Candidatus Moranbacteria bacterium]